MQKQKLIHVHALLYEIKTHIEENENIEFADIVSMSAYNDLGTSPTDIHKGREKHVAAVQKLSELVVEGVEEIDIDENRKREMVNNAKETESRAIQQSIK